MFIYSVTNKANGKRYVGMTTSTVETRWKGHIADATRLHKGQILYKAIRKYGPDAFEVVGIDFAENKEQLQSKEMFWIRELNSLAPAGYNMTTGGECTSMSEVLKAKLSVSATNRFSREGEKEKQSARISAAVAAGKLPQCANINEYWKIPAAKEKHSAAKKVLWAQDREKYVTAQRAGWTPEARERASNAAVLRQASGVYESKKRAVVLSDGREFSSISECALAIGGTASNVGETARGRRKSVKGFTVKFIKHQAAPKVVHRDAQGNIIGVTSQVGE